MENRFRRIVRLTKSEFMAAVDDMTPEERHVFGLWLRHEDDQRYAKVVQAKEDSETGHRVFEILMAHGFGTPGKEIFRDIVPLLSPEERVIVTKILTTLLTDGLWRAVLQENESA
jgi:hypothetical protein